MEKIELLEVITKKANQNLSVKEDINNIKNKEDLIKIADKIYCFSAQDMINFAAYFKSENSDSSEENINRILIEWFNKTN